MGAGGWGLGAGGKREGMTPIQEGTGVINAMQWMLLFSSHPSNRHLTFYVFQCFQPLRKTLQYLQVEFQENLFIKTKCWIMFSAGYYWVQLVVLGTIHYPVLIIVVPCLSRNANRYHHHHAHRHRSVPQSTFFERTHTCPLSISQAWHDCVN